MGPVRMFITGVKGTVHILRPDHTTCLIATRQPKRVQVSAAQCKVYKLAPCGHCWPQEADFQRNINRRIK